MRESVAERGALVRRGREVKDEQGSSSGYPIADGPETFNFVTRNASGVDEQLKAFIAKYKHCYQKDKDCYAAAP